MDELFFYTLASVIMSLSLTVVLGTQPVKSALSLVAVFISTALLWLDLGAEFLALALIFVYVGAVMVLFLFIVFMINTDYVESTLSWFARLCLLLTAVCFVGYVVYQYSGEQYPMPDLILASNIKSLGQTLYTDYIWVFETLGCILLAAMVAVVSLIDEPRRQTKQQIIRDQIARDSKDIRWMR